MQRFVHLHMNERSDFDSSFSLIHFLEMSTSILHEIPGIQQKDVNVSCLKVSPILKLVTRYSSC